MSGIKGNWTVSKRDDGTGGNLEVANTLTADTLIISNSVTLPGVIIDAHSHSADAIVSGTIDADRLPKGDGNDEFGVIKIGTAGGLDLSDGILTIDAAALSTLLQLGTAAGADTGTASGNVPILDGSGRLPISVMPAQTIGGEYLGEVANAESMVILSQATSGDFCKRLDTGTYWMLGSSAPGAYSNAANWLEYAGAVTSVNGVIGAVTLSDLGLVTAVSVNSDTTFPSCKAIAGYIAGQISDLNLSGTYVKITALENYATAASVSELQNYVDATYATTATVRGMIEGALTGYVSPSSLEAALANYALSVHTHTSAQISDATRTGGQNADAGKAVLLSDGGKIAVAMVPVDGASIVLSNGTISVSDSWLEDEVHDYTKKEVSSVSGTVINLTESGQVFDKSLSADATITLNTSELVLDAGEVVEFDLFLTLGAGVTAHLPGWMTDKGPIYNYAEEGKTLFHVWSYDGGTTWNASKESWFPPDNWIWVTTLSDAIGHEGTSLRDAIGAANNGDVIKFIPELEGTITLEQGQIIPTKRLTIEGGGKITIDGNRQSRCFHMTNPNCEGSVIRGLTITKCRAPEASGGAIYAGPSLTVEDCIFDDNHADGADEYTHGGALMMVSGTLTLKRCKFLNNKVTGVSKGIYGGAIYITSTKTGHTITDCTFENNTLYTSGGGSRNGSGIAAQGIGGGITITGSSFKGNTEADQLGYIYGGGLWVANYAFATVIDSSFTNNGGYTDTKTSAGGALYGGGVEIYTVTNCTFKGNKSRSGGVFYAAGTTSRPNIASAFTNCTFTENIAGYMGGCLYVAGGTNTITDCRFTNNTGTSQCGGVYITTGTTTVSGCYFSGNGVGRELWLANQTNGRVSDCIFENGTLGSLCLYVERTVADAPMTVERCIFRGNTLTNPTVGVVSVESSGVATITDCVFMNNDSPNAPASQRAVVYSAGNGAITATGLTIVNNGNLKPFRASSGSLDLSNSVSVGNATGPDIQMLTVDHCLSDDSWGDITYDSEQPLFDEDGYTPVEGSQVIDAGDSSLTSSETDFNGDPRIVGEAVDLGAVEYQGNAAALTLNRLNIRNLNRMNNLNSLNLDPEGIEEELPPEPELEDETEHEEWLRQQELNGGDQR